MAERKPFTVKAGNLSLKLSPYRGGWRFGYRDGERWRYVFRKAKAAAKLAAEETLEDMPTGTVWSALPASTRRWLEAMLELAPDREAREAALGFLESRQGSLSVELAVEQWLAAKESRAGERTPYLTDLGNRMRAWGSDMGSVRVADITHESLAEWVKGRTAGRSVKFYIDVRAGLVEFWRWCRLQGLVDGQAALVAERLPTAKRKAMERRVASPAELVALLNGVGDAWRAWIVLGAWAGLRPEEIAPRSDRKKAAKRGLHCDDIDWSFGVLRVPACVSKIGRPRVVPMCATLKAGLEWAGIGPGMAGPVVLQNPVEAKETARLGKLVFGSAWPKDILRHSFGSYRNALLRNLPQVAEEMGTSEAMLHAHYHNPRAEAEGAAWFNVRKSSDGIGGAWEESGDETEGPNVENPLKVAKGL